MTARYVVGDVFDVLASLPDASVDLVLTSPPFLALRSYLPSDHPDKAKEIGSEPTPAAFLDTLLDLTVEWRRVLAPHGSICVELGDTYSGSGGAGGDYSDGGLRGGQQAFDGSASGRRRALRKGYGGAADRLDAEVPKRGAGWPLDKSLTFMPQLYGASLAYGRNLLNPDHTIDPWRVRNVVAWCRPNPPVGALGDKVRPATSYLTMACTARDRWFDLDAVRTPLARDYTGEKRGGVKAAGTPEGGGYNHVPGSLNITTHPAGAPPLDWWEIPTQPYAGSHYATWPEALCIKPIELMCPRRVCTTCGEPSRRIVGDAEYVTANGETHNGRPRDKSKTIANGYGAHSGKPDGATTRVAPTLGWTDCEHNAWRPGVVLDPFAGSGTTLAVAVSLARDAIGIDLDARNLLLAEQRVGMFLEVAS